MGIAIGLMVQVAFVLQLLDHRGQGRIRRFRFRELIQNISEAARQQSVAATNISGTMNVIQEITTQTSAGTQQTAESIGNLVELATELRKSVEDFKLPDDEFFWLLNMQRNVQNV